MLPNFKTKSQLSFRQSLNSTVATLGKLLTCHHTAWGGADVICPCRVFDGWRNRRRSVRCAECVGLGGHGAGIGERAEAWEGLVRHKPGGRGRAQKGQDRRGRSPSSPTLAWYLQDRPEPQP